MRKKRLPPMSKKELKIYLWIIFFLVSVSIYQTYNDLGPLIFYFIILTFYYLKKNDLIRKEDFSLFKNKDKGDDVSYIEKIDSIILETNKNMTNNFVYKKKQFLLTKNELKFYHLLNETISNEYTIMCSVRLIDILQPANKNDIVSKNKIIQKQIDFLVCSKGYLNPILAIELNDSSHKKQKRYERDNFLDLAFQSAGLPLLFISTNDINRISYLKSLLSEFLKVV